MKLTKYIDDAKKYGIKITIKQIFYKIVNKVIYVKTEQVMILLMSSLDSKYLKVPSQFRARFLSLQDLEKFSSNSDYQMTPSFVENAFIKGDYCFGIIENEILANYGWYSKTSTDLTDHLVLNFNNEWVYMYKGYTHPEYRGQRLHAIGMANALQYFTDNGARGLISCVQTTNIKSLLSTERMGYENIGKVRMYKIFGKYITKHSSSCSLYGFSIKPKICSR